MVKFWTKILTYPFVLGNWDGLRIWQDVHGLEVGGETAKLPDEVGEVGGEVVSAASTWGCLGHLELRPNELVPAWILLVLADPEKI